MNRAVGAQPVVLLHFSQGAALGWYELTPLASQKNVQTPALGFPAPRCGWKVAAGKLRLESRNHRQTGMSALREWSRKRGDYDYDYEETGGPFLILIVLVIVISGAVLPPHPPVI
jgi:hypothetical protein